MEDRGLLKLVLPTLMLRQGGLKEEHFGGLIECLFSTIKPHFKQMATPFGEFLLRSGGPTFHPIFQDRPEFSGDVGLSLHNRGIFGWNSRPPDRGINNRQWSGRSEKCVWGIVSATNNPEWVVARITYDWTYDSDCPAAVFPVEKATTVSILRMSHQKKQMEKIAEAAGITLKEFYFQLDLRIDEWCKEVEALWSRADNLSRWRTFLKDNVDNM